MINLLAGIFICALAALFVGGILCSNLKEVKAFDPEMDMEDLNHEFRSDVADDKRE